MVHDGKATVGLALAVVPVSSLAELTCNGVTQDHENCRDL